MKAIIKMIAIFLIAILVIYSTADIVQASSEKEIVLVIDPGHGGKMTGTANSELGLVERDITLKIARYLRDYLNEYEGIKVIMTHNGLPSDYEMELPARGMVARNNNADMMISLHINDYSTPNQQGAEVFVTANKLLPKYNQESTRFGNLVLNELAKLGIAKRGVKTKLCGDTGPKWEYSDGSVADYYAVIRYPMKGDGEDRGADLAKGEGIPGVLIEHCFMKGHDAQFLDSEQDLQKLARADCNALVAFYGLEKKDPSRVSSITLNKQATTLIVGQKETLQATVTPNTATNKKVSWSSSNTEVATVSANGEITAKKAGKVTITAKTQDRGKTATCEVTVQEVSLTLSKKETNLLVGKKAQIDYTITPETVANKTVMWKSSDETIATVSKEGIITALKEGTINITATLEQEKKQATVKVNVHKLAEGQNIQIKNLKEENSILSKIQEKTTVADYKKNLEVSDDIEMIIKNNEEKELENTDYVGTATTTLIREKKTKKVLQEYINLIYGEIDGDGVIDSYDMYLLRAHMIETSRLKGINFVSANISRDDNMIDSYDMYLLRAHMINKEIIKQ